MADVSQIRLPNGDTFDLIDEKSGYITAQYIENKTDYSIPVSRVGEIVVGETAIGTDSTNFPTSKAVVDYVDERVVQEIEAIDVGVTSVNGKTGSVTLSASDVGAATTSYVANAINDYHSYIYNQIPTSTSQLTNDSGFITASDETDPVFSASAAAGITATDISNWNAKVSDDKTWNGVTLNKNQTIGSNFYVPKVNSMTDTTASYVYVTTNPNSGRIPRYDGDAYLYSTTPSANDNSTKVATTAYIDAAIPKVYSSTNTGGYLTMATLPIYDGTVV